MIIDYRYVKLTWLTSESNFRRFRSFELYSDTWGINDTIGAVATASSFASGAEMPSNVLDGNTSTVWANNASDTIPWLKIDLGAVKNEFLGIAALFQTYTGAFKIELSEDDITYTQVYETGPSDVRLVGTVIANARLYITPRILRMRRTQYNDTSWTGIGYFDLLDNAGASLLPFDVAHLWGTRSNTGTEAFINIRDLSTANGWLATRSPDPLDLFIAIDNPEDIKTLSMRALTGTRAWKGFDITYSDDGMLTWSDPVLSIVEQIGWVTAEVRTYTLLIPPTGDIYWDNVSLLLNLDWNIIDQKAHVLTAIGTVTYAPARFNGGLSLTTGNSGLRGTLSEPDYSFGTGDFTIECWVNPSTPPGDGVIINQFNNNVNASNGWQLLMTAAGVLRFYQYVSGGSYPLTATGIDIRGAWHHVVVERKGSTLRMYIDGVMVGKTTNTTDYGSNNLYLSIGYQEQGSARYPYRGQIDEVRITKGLARYANDAGFAPLTAPFPIGPYVPSPVSPASPASPASPTSPLSPTSPTSPPPPSPGGDPAYLTQLPLLVLDSTPKATRFTQLPLLVLYAEYQPSRVTQAPVEVIYETKPVPLPKPIIPDIPVRESWIWNTTIKIAYKNKEQRMRLREYPRYRMTITALILSEQDRRDIYAMLMRYVKQTFIYPLFHLNAHITADASVGTDKLYCDPARTDIRAGEYVALFDPHIEKVYYLETLAVDSDGIQLAEPLLIDVAKDWQVCPAIDFRLSSGTGFNMNNIDGSFEIMMESVNPRVFQRPTANPTVVTKDGILIVADRYNSVNSIDENFLMDNDWLDNSMSIPEVINKWSNPFVASKRVYTFNRFERLDYWRKVCDMLKGRQGVALFPTFRDDIDRRSPVVAGSNIIETNNIELFKYWLEPNYRYIRIETATGVTYNKILDVQAVYDADGIPYYLRIKVETAIVDTNIKAISYMNLCRLDDDQVDLVHGYDYTDISFSIRAVNA